MHPHAAPSAPAADDSGPVPLWTVDDLHDADLDLLLADRLAEYAVTLPAAAAVVERSLLGEHPRRLAG